MRYLAHHGIKGMRWGVRNYQNPDGSLTEEGRRRYGSGSGEKRTFVGKVSKAIGDHFEAKEQARKEKFAKEVAELEAKSMYDFSVNDPKKPIDQRLKDTEDQLVSICDAHARRLSAVMDTIPWRYSYDDGDSIYDGGFAQELATRINERFDSDQVLDQHMSEYVVKYREGIISKGEFKKRYETELNDYAAWCVDNYTLDELKTVAKTFTDSEGYAPGDYEITSPKTGWKDYLRRMDSLDGVDSSSMNRQNSDKGESFWKRTKFW